jgi:hypothetical protein
MSGGHETSLLWIPHAFSAKLRALSVSALSFLRSFFPFNFQRSIIAVSLRHYFFTSLRPYLVSSSRKHSSKVFTANSAWTSSITSGGQNRTVVSPDPRMSRPL